MLEIRKGESQLQVSANPTEKTLEIELTDWLALSSIYITLNKEEVEQLKKELEWL